MTRMYVKKTITKNGKRYGPYPKGADYYIYERKWVEGKVKQVYLGRGPKPEPRNSGSEVSKKFDKIFENADKIERARKKERETLVEGFKEFEWMLRDEGILNTVSELLHSGKYSEVIKIGEAWEIFDRRAKDLEIRSQGYPRFSSLIDLHRLRAQPEAEQNKVESEIKRQELSEKRNHALRALIKDAKNRSLKIDEIDRKEREMLSGPPPRE